MVEYECPACGGGFPEDALLDGRGCPWCEFQLHEAADYREGFEVGNQPYSY